MQVHPAIAALRNDPVSQRQLGERVAAALNGWHDQALIAEMRRELTEYAGHGTLERCPQLVALATDPRRAQAFVAELCNRFIAVLREHPLAEVPFRHGWGDGFSRMLLLQVGGATLSLCVYEPGPEVAEPESVRFVDSACHEMVVAGRASGRFYERDPHGEAITMRNCRWSAGDPIVRQPNLHARAVLAVEQSLLLLQLARAPARSGPSRVLRLSDGALIQQACGDKRASEQVMALGVLGALGHHDAIDPMVRFAHDCAHDPDARWEAVRQVLALDAARGVALLGVLGRDAGDALAGPANDLREQLMTAHPQLREIALEAMPCRS